MIIFGSIIISLLVSIFLWWKFRKELVWWELVVLNVVAIGLSIGSKFLIEHTQVKFTEYWGSEVAVIYEEEPWNEWISKTCSESYACGTDANGNTQYCTRYYDCSYQDDNGPDWWGKTTTGETINISEKQYDKWSKIFGTERKIHKKRRNHSSRSKCYYSKGTKFAGQRVGKHSFIYKVYWDKDYSKSVPVTTKHSYENRIKASDYTVFNYQEISDEEVKEKKLYEYPKLKNSFEYPTVLGTNDRKIQKLFHKINGNLGPKKQVRLWILLHYSADDEIGWLQENYWVGGNKNELVINIGIDSLQNVGWCHIFSWSNSQGLKDDISSYIEGKEKLDYKTWQEIASYIKPNVEKDFERLQFTQFDYLSVDPPIWAIIVTYIVTLIVSLIIGKIVISNSARA